MSQTDDDLLLGISNLLDRKLGVIQNDLSDVRNEIVLLRTDVSRELISIRADIRSINIRMENDILPRLQNIEDCYLSTYRRYQSGVNQIDAIQADVDVLKAVVTNHSGILQNMA